MSGSYWEKIARRTATQQVWVSGYEMHAPHFVAGCGGLDPFAGCFHCYFFWSCSKVVVVQKVEVSCGLSNTEARRSVKQA